jgi:hypothetical protein
MSNSRSAFLWFFVLASLAAGLCLLGSCRRGPEALEEWDLPSDFAELAEHQEKLTTLVLPPKVTRFDWLPDGLEHLEAPGSAATVVRGCPGYLQSLDLSYSEVRFLAGLPDGLEQLDIRFTNLTKVPELPDGITRLALGGDAISSYQGIPADLRELVMEEAPKLAVLDKLPRKLESLTLIGASFTDLGGLPLNLQALTLKWTGVKTLVDLPDSIRTLVLEENRQLDIGKDDLPPFLTVLIIKGTAVPDLSRLSYLVELEIGTWDPTSWKLPPGLRTLRLNGIEVPQDARELSSLRTLGILGSDLAETSALPAHLERLELRGSRLPDLQAVPPQWSSLRHLDLGWTGLTRLPPLPESIVSLDLSATDIVDLTGLPTLSTLRFRRSTVTELRGLPESLEELDLADSRNLKQIHGPLPKLRSLNVGGTAFVSLAELPRTIRVLDIRDTGIASLQGVPPGLEELTLCRGQMTSLAELPPSVHTLRFLEPVAPEKIEP